LDDIIVFSQTFEEHVQRLNNVFRKLHEAGLKLNPSKCSFFQKQVKYLGHLVSERGIETCPEKVEAVRQWPVPTTHKEVRQFLGFAGFYRRFIKDYASIAQPLQEMLQGHLENRGNSKKKKFVNSGKFIWLPIHETAFQKLKSALTEAPVLAYADYSLPYTVSVDASGYSVGAVLYQVQQGVKRVIAYASRGLNESEKRYPVHKREFLAMKWAITEKFRDYLFYSKFEVLTDNNPLTYVLSTAKVDATGHRWLADLSNFSFSIKYKPGPKNKDADALSRIAWSEDQVKSVLAGITEVDSLGQVPAVVSMQQNVTFSVGSGATSAGQWQQMQGVDPVLAPVIRVLQGEDTPRDLPSESKCLMREIKNLLIDNGVLCRKRTVNGECLKQIVLPSSCTRTVFDALHTEMGHPGRDKTMELVRDRFYWPKMSCQIDQWIKVCDRCLRRKSTPDVAPLHPVTSTQPLELVCIDYLSLESQGQYSNILVITDHFTRYAHAVATTNQTAKTTARILLEHFIQHYGFPIRLHSDRGGSFEGHVIHELCHLVGVQKSRTTPYHPKGNGACERFNRTLLGMLGTLTAEQKSKWRDQLSHVVHAYNCMRHESTGFTPFELMYGRQPRLPVDIVFSLCSDTEQRSYSDFVSELRKKMKTAYEIAEAKVQEMKERNKDSYKSRGGAIRIGDRVLVKRLAFPEGKHKLSDKWEEEAYVVVGQMDPNLPVFDVRREHNPRGGRTKRLHRNHLLAIGSVQDVIDARDEMHLRKDEEDREEEESDEEVQLYMSESEDEMEQMTRREEPRQEVEERIGPERDESERTDETNEDGEEHSAEDEEEVEELRRGTRIRQPTQRYVSVDFRR